MKLLRVHIIHGATCGGLLDGLDLQLRPWNTPPTSFDPLCLIGPNGSGKSQLIQAISEIFQSAIHAVSPTEERKELNPDIEFEVEYSILPKGYSKPALVRLERKREGIKKAGLVIYRHYQAGWKRCKTSAKSTRSLLPDKVIGYTSGGNETLSLPFLVSRSGYANEVASRALGKTSADIDRSDNAVSDPRLMLVDYHSHIEVLVANVMLGSKQVVSSLLSHANLEDLRAFRIIVQTGHSAARRLSTKEVILPSESKETIEKLKSCSTCWHYDEKDKSYIFDYFVNPESKKAFRYFWKQRTLELYSALRKLSMLNDLILPPPARKSFTSSGAFPKFASQLPEPFDEDKVFRFEHVTLAGTDSGLSVDYSSLSDGEHQLAQILGTFAMASFPGVLFLLDEPESHSNPQWRVEFISALMNLRTPKGDRRSGTLAARQDALMTTHAPFVPSDLDKQQVLIFSKDPKTKEVAVKRPLIQTFGSSFEAILEECFGVTPPISGEARSAIDKLRKSKSEKNVAKGMEKLGYSLEKAMLSDHLRNLRNDKK